MNNECKMIIINKINLNKNVALNKGFINTCSYNINYNKNIIKILYFILLATVLLYSSVSYSKTDNYNYFVQASKNYEENKFDLSASFFWQFLKVTEKTNNDFEKAEFYFASSLNKLGFSHAAVEYFVIIAEERKNIELLPATLYALESVVNNPNQTTYSEKIENRFYGYDEEQIITKLLWNNEFGILPFDLKDFVNYYQGLLDYKHDFETWGNIHSTKISDKGYYTYKTKYLLAIWNLKKGFSEKAIKLFYEILNADVDDNDLNIKLKNLKNKTAQNIGRLLYEKEKYKEALEIYNKIDTFDYKNASLLLDKAWTLYQLSDYSKSMGLLFSLKAPVYRDYFQPEMYVLKYLIFRDLCNYDLALQVIYEFKNIYKHAILKIKNREDLKQNNLFMTAVYQEKNLKMKKNFLELLIYEQKKLEQHKKAFLKDNLFEHLNRVYKLKIEQISTEISFLINNVMKNISLKLLDYEEQMNLLEYEVGLEKYKKKKNLASDNKIKIEKLDIPYYGNKIYYQFDNEFWNDEIHSYKLFIKNKCVDYNVK